VNRKPLIKFNPDEDVEKHIAANLNDIALSLRILSEIAESNAYHDLTEYEMEPLVEKIQEEIDNVDL
jgi:hypothetical protein